MKATTIGGLIALVIYIIISVILIPMGLTPGEGFAVPYAIFPSYIGWMFVFFIDEGLKLHLPNSINMILMVIVSGAIYYGIGALIGKFFSWTARKIKSKKQ
jgi:hypothetical protein